MTRISGLLRASIAAAVLVQTVACAPSAPPGPRVVDIPAPDGVVLKGTLFAAPAGGPAVLLLHQCDEQRHVWDPLGPTLAAAGITALAVDYRGYGESGGTPHDKLTNAELGSMMTTAWPGDIDAAFAFLSKQPGVQPARAGAAGGSCSVSQAIQLARRHNTVKALALLAGPANRDERTFLETPGAPPVFAAAAADDRYANFVEINGWLYGVSPRAESRLAQYPTGGHAAVVFGTHPELAGAIAQWFGALLKDPPGALPATNGVPLAPGILDELRAIDRPGGAAAAIARLTANGGSPANAPRVPEYFVNLLGYEHVQMKDDSSAIELMRLNTLLYPESANTMDSLADAYLAAGDRAAALAAAKRALELLASDTRATPERKAAVRTAAEDKIKRLSASKS